MGQDFGIQLRIIREKYFPGKSLRSVSEELEKKGFSGNFFTHLSKLESGSTLPSEELLKRLLDAYGASDTERDNIFALFLGAKLEESVLQAGNHGISEQAVGLLFRKIKNNRKP